MSKYACVISDWCLSCTQPEHTVATHVWNEDHTRFKCVMEGCGCEDFTPPKREDKNAELD
jgi:hypothetical protein